MQEKRCCSVRCVCGGEGLAASVQVLLHLKTRAPSLLHGFGIRFSLLVKKKLYTSLVVSIAQAWTLARGLNYRFHCIW